MTSEIVKITIIAALGRINHKWTKHDVMTRWRDDDNYSLYTRKVSERSHQCNECIQYLIGHLRVIYQFWKINHITQCPNSASEPHRHHSYRSRRHLNCRRCRRHHRWYNIMYIVGVDQRQCDGVGWRCRILSSKQCDGVGGERGECSPFDSVAGTDHSTQCSRHEESIGDPLREGIDLLLHAGQTKAHQLLRTMRHILVITNVWKMCHIINHLWPTRHIFIYLITRIWHRRQV